MSSHGRSEFAANRFDSSALARPARHRALQADATAAAAGANANQAQRIPLQRVKTWLEITHLASVQVNAKFSIRMEVNLVHDKSWIACDALASKQEQTEQASSSSSSSSFSCSALCPVNATTLRYYTQTLCASSSSLESLQLGPVTFKEYQLAIAHDQNRLTNGENSLLHGGAQGVLGLSKVFKYGDTKKADPTTQLADRLESFSVFLHDATDQDESFLMLNGVDEDLIRRRKLTRHFMAYPFYLREPSTHRIGISFWSIPLHKIRLDNETLNAPWVEYVDPRYGSNPFRKAVLDINSRFVTMPTPVFDKVFQKHLVGCSMQSDVEAHDAKAVLVCPRDTHLPTISFLVWNSSTTTLRFELTTREYTERLAPPSNRNQSDELLAVYVKPDPTLQEFWILGEPFLRKYYTQFHPNLGVSVFCPEHECLMTNARWYASTTVWICAVAVVVVSMVCFGFSKPKYARRRKDNDRVGMKMDR